MQQITGAMRRPLHILGAFWFLWIRMHMRRAGRPLHIPEAFWFLILHDQVRQTNIGRFPSDSDTIIDCWKRDGSGHNGCDFI
jgi:hypothetical protein